MTYFRHFAAVPAAMRAVTGAAGLAAAGVLALAGPVAAAHPAHAAPAVRKAPAQGVDPGGTQSGAGNGGTVDNRSGSGSGAGTSTGDGTSSGTNDGSLIVHDQSTPPQARYGDPRVCVFYLDAFGPAGARQVGWSVARQPPAGTAARVLADAIALDAGGRGITENMALPPGRYALSWTVTPDGRSARHSDFTVDCAAPLPGAPAPGTAGAPPAPAADASAAGAAKAPAGSGGKVPVALGDGLALTGAHLGRIGGIAAVLLLAGSALAVRRRNARG
jgi:hypothetical protein